MAGNKRPAFQFYPSDWLADPELRSMSLAARGLWIDLLCHAHHGQPYGHVRSKTGQPYTPCEIARMVGADSSEVETLLAELEKHGVFSRSEDGAIYSRRMVADFEKYQEFIAQKSAAGRASATARSTGTQREPQRTTQRKPNGNPNGNPNGSPTDDPTEAQRESNPPVSSLQSPSPVSKKRKKASNKPEYTPEFERFWTLSWKRGSKRKAFDSWVAITETEDAQTPIIEVVNEWGVVFEKREPKFQPHVSTWLNNRGWEDDLGAETGAKKKDDVELGWMYGTYRFADVEKHGDDPRWEAYMQDAATHPPYQAPTFEEWTKEER